MSNHLNEYSSKYPNDIEMGPVDDQRKSDSIYFALVLKWLIIVAIFAFSLIFGSRRSLGDTVIVKVIEQRQEQRKSTRWTLTEWLRIKERMKMMDVWLAMFSPKEPEFTPELNLYGRKRLASMEISTSQESPFAYEGEEKGFSVWLTNLVSSSTGIRTLNIDIGFEGGNYTADKVTGEAASPVTGSDEKFKISTTSAGVNLRILGSHSQDNSLVLGVGRETSSGDFSRSTSGDFLYTDYGGQYQKALMKLYLAGFLGIEGEYRSTEVTVSSNVDAVQKFDKTTTRYGAFIEISLLRFEYFVVEETKKFSDFDDVTTKGQAFGLMLQI